MLLTLHNLHSAPTRTHCVYFNLKHEQTLKRQPQGAGPGAGGTRGVRLVQLIPGSDGLGSSAVILGHAGSLAEAARRLGPRLGQVWNTITQQQVQGPR